MESPRDLHACVLAKAFNSPAASTHCSSWPCRPLALPLGLGGPGVGAQGLINGQSQTNQEMLVLPSHSLSWATPATSVDCQGCCLSEPTLSAEKQGTDVPSAEAQAPGFLVFSQRTLELSRKARNPCFVSPAPHVPLGPPKDPGGEGPGNGGTWIEHKQDALT